MRRLIGAGLSRRLPVQTPAPYIADTLFSLGASPRAFWCLHTRVRNQYTGPAFLARRSDGQELDIRFLANGSVDLVTMGAFFGSLDGFVKTAYDQINAYDLTETTQANMPKIWTGATQTASVGPTNGRLAMSMVTASNQRLTRSDGCGFSGSVALTMFADGTQTTAVAGCLLMVGAPTTANGARLLPAAGNNAGRVAVAYGSPLGNRVFTSASSVANPHYYVAPIGAGMQAQNVPLYQDGSVLGQFSISGGTNTVSYANTGTGWGAQPSFGSPMTGQSGLAGILSSEISGQALDALHSWLATYKL